MDMLDLVKLVAVVLLSSVMTELFMAIRGYRKQRPERERLKDAVQLFGNEQSWRQFHYFYGFSDQERDNLVKGLINAVQIGMREEELRRIVLELLHPVLMGRLPSVEAALQITAVVREILIDHERKLLRQRVDDADVHQRQQVALADNYRRSDERLGEQLAAVQGFLYGPNGPVLKAVEEGDEQRVIEEATAAG